ncbi:hypothetical protein GQ55_8G072600 [Panicum hallii var. hallii]|uniref:F-box domain-containing protein n=1 Tax=Panicum hallii var. hallii TaxID=1504633 RepID=A0A2T7CLK4_9POAL|nr:hypothetical protein GQ55_8G072600 [Panicum hallii var. hallii]
MAGRTRFSDLHDDLVAAVLARLPLRQVARARLVCRRWRALTADHSFLRITASRRTAAGFFVNDHLSVRADYVPFPLDCSTAAEDGPSPDLSFIPSAALPGDPPRGGIGDVHVSSSCNGLLLLWCPIHRPAGHYACNPLTRELARIPVVEGLHSLNLAFDPSVSPHYRVVAFGHVSDIHVYSSETRCWGAAVHHDRSLFSGLRSVHGVFWNGSMVWTVGHSLVQFVLEGGHLKTIPMPPKRKKGWFCAYIGVSARHLQMIGYTKEEKLTACFEILEMQRGRSEWSHLYRVDLGRVKELHPEIEWPTWDSRSEEHKVIGYLALSPVCLVRGTGEAGKHGVLIFSIPGKIMLYDMKDQRISVVGEVRSSVRELHSLCHFEHPWYYFYAYSPSLFTV